MTKKHDAAQISKYHPRQMDWVSLDVMTTRRDTIKYGRDPRNEAAYIVAYLPTSKVTHLPRGVDLERLYQSG